MNFEINFGVDNLKRALAAAREAIGNSDLLGAIGESVLDKHMARHRQGLAPDGTPWKPLESSTIGGRAWEKQDKKFRESNSKRGPVHSI